MPGLSGAGGGHGVGGIVSHGGDHIHSSHSHSHNHQQQQYVQHGLMMSSLSGDIAVMCSPDPKPRLRWTPELHERFVEAVTQLGGADKATPKTVMKAMGVKGLTLYHLKSHLQKYRLGKKAQRTDVVNVVEGGSTPSESLSVNGQCEVAAPAHDNNGEATFIHCNVTPRIPKQEGGLNVCDQVDSAQKRLCDQIEAGRNLKQRIEVESKYLQSILDKAQNAYTTSQATIENFDDLSILCTNTNHLEVLEFGGSSFGTSSFCYEGNMGLEKRADNNVTNTMSLTQQMVEFSQEEGTLSGTLQPQPLNISYPSFYNDENLRTNVHEDVFAVDTYPSQLHLNVNS